MTFLFAFRFTDHVHPGALDHALVACRVIDAVDLIQEIAIRTDTKKKLDQMHWFTDLNHSSLLQFFYKFFFVFWRKRKMSFKKLYRHTFIFHVINFPLFKSSSFFFSFFFACRIKKKNRNHI